LQLKFEAWYNTVEACANAFLTIIIPWKYSRYYGGEQGSEIPLFGLSIHCHRAKLLLRAHSMTEPDKGYF
jgi:hypothetical protein